MGLIYLLQVSAKLEQYSGCGWLLFSRNVLPCLKGKYLCFDGDFCSIMKHKKRHINKIKALGTHFTYCSIRAAAIIEGIQVPKFGN